MTDRKFTKDDWPAFIELIPTVATWPDSHEMFSRDPANASLRVYFRFHAREKLADAPSIALDGTLEDLAGAFGCGTYTIGLVTWNPDSKGIERQWTTNRHTVDADRAPVRRWTLDAAMRSKVEDDWREMLAVRELLHGRDVSDLKDLERSLADVRAELEGGDEGGDDDADEDTDGAATIATPAATPMQATVASVPAAAPVQPTTVAVAPAAAPVQPAVPMRDAFALHYGDGDDLGTTQRYGTGRGREDVDRSGRDRYEEERYGRDRYEEERYGRDRYDRGGRDRYEEERRPSPYDDIPPPPPVRPETVYDASTGMDYLFPADAPATLESRHVQNGHWFNVKRRGWFPLERIPAPPPPPPPTQGFGGHAPQHRAAESEFDRALALMQKLQGFGKPPPEDPIVTAARIEAEARLKEKEMELQRQQIASEDTRRRDAEEREEKRHAALLAALNKDKVDPIDLLRGEMASRDKRFEDLLARVSAPRTEAPPKDPAASAFDEIERIAKFAERLGYSKETVELRQKLEQARAEQWSPKEIVGLLGNFVDPVLAKVDKYLENTGAVKVLEAKARSDEAEKARIETEARAHRERLEAELDAKKKELALLEEQQARARARIAQEHAIAGPLPPPQPQSAQAQLPFGPGAEPPAPPPVPLFQEPPAPPPAVLPKPPPASPITLGPQYVEPELPESHLPRPPPPPAPPPLPQQQPPSTAPDSA